MQRFRNHIKILVPSIIARSLIFS